MTIYREILVPRYELTNESECVLTDPCELTSTTMTDPTGWEKVDAHVRMTLSTSTSPRWLSKDSTRGRGTDHNLASITLFCFCHLLFLGPTCGTKSCGLVSGLVYQSCYLCCSSWVGLTLNEVVIGPMGICIWLDSDPLTAGLLHVRNSSWGPTTDDLMC